MSLFTNLFSSTGLSIKFDNSMNSFVVMDSNKNIKYVGPKDLCGEYVKNFSAALN